MGKQLSMTIPSMITRGMTTSFAALETRVGRSVDAFMICMLSTVRYEVVSPVSHASAASAGYNQGLKDSSKRIRWNEKYVPIS